MTALPPAASPSDSDPESSDVKDFLISLTTLFINYHITRDMTGLLSVDFLTPKFTNLTPHRHFKAITLEEYVSQYQEYLKICPEFSIKILSISGEVRSGKAWIMVDSEQGIGDGVVMPSFGVFSWREENGKWVCWKIDSMRGIAG